MGRTGDILEATRMFSEGLKNYQVNNAFRDATEKFKQLDAQEEDTFKKRAAQEQMAKDLSSQLLGMGASPQQVTQGFQTYMPQAMTGSKDFFNAAANKPEGKERDAYNQRGLELQAQEQKITPQQELQHREALAALRAQAAASSGKEAGEKVPITEVTAMKKFDESLMGLQSILTTAKKNPDFVGFGQAGGIPVPELMADFGKKLKSMGNSEYATFRSAVGKQVAAYVNEITGAGVGEKERDILSKNTITGDEEPEVFERKVKTNILVGERFRKEHLKTMEQLGYNVEKIPKKSVTSTGNEFDTEISRLQALVRALKASNPGSPLIQQSEDQINALTSGYMVGK